ncbi:MAG TPA: hypothetical protein VKS78_00740 [Roseiarcus sp.]|nr:hypothetical protein [Roseiarcus sp.]
MTVETWRRELTAAASDSAPARLSPSLIVAAGIFGLTLLGFALRLIFAAGPLWIDEIWSIQNLAPLTRPWQVFWGVSHDNNHFLNSLWLYFVSEPAANNLALRAPALLLGAATIPAMAALGARHSRAAALATAALAAFSFFFITYGAVARGYAGETLALVIGFMALERAIDEPAAHARLVLAGAAGVGALWHLGMAPAVALYALIAFLEQRRRLGTLASAATATFRIFWPSLLAILPAAAFVAAGYFITGRFTIGKVDPYDSFRALKAMALVVFSTLGLPMSTPFLLVAAATPLALVAALRSKIVLPERRIAYAVMLLAAPAAVFLLRPENTDVPRYYLVCGLFLVLLAGEAFGSLWRAGTWRRGVAAAALVAVLIGDAVQFARFEASLDGAWPNALAAIANSGERHVATTFDSGFDKFVAYFDATHAARLDLIPERQWCAARPDWLVTDLTRDPMPATMT